MKEEEIRPKVLLRKYLELCDKDISQFFSGCNKSEISCVACGNEKKAFAFEKNGFPYAVCHECKSLYQTPRPEINLFEEFYKDSESSNFWSEVFFPSVAEIRREMIFRKRAEQIFEKMNSRGLTVDSLVDVGAGYGIFLDEWRKLSPDTELIAIEPGKSLAEECRNKNLKVHEMYVEDVTNLESSAELVVCFEVLEHVHDPFHFVNVLKNIAKPGGYVLISTLGIDGFDLQLLWDKSTQISPPHHINFLSILGMEKLLSRAGFSEFEITTPGVLDVDIVRNFVKGNPGTINLDAFLENLFDQPETSEKFQQFLSTNKMSSHTWLLCKKD